MIRNTAPSYAVGLDAHELLDQRVERRDPVLGCAAIKDPGATHVPGGEIAERPTSLIFVLDQLPVTVGLGGLAGMLARTGLDRRFLIGAHDQIAGF